MSGAPEFLKAQARYVELQQQQRTRDSGKARIGCAPVSFGDEPDPLPEAVAREPKPTKLADALLANGLADDAGDLVTIAMTIETAFPLSAKRIREIAAHLRSLMGAAS